MSNKTKKLLILNLPYFIAGLVCTNLGEAWKATCSPLKRWRTALFQSVL